MERQWPNGTVVLEDGKRQLPYIYPEEDDPNDEEIVPRPPLPPEQRCYQEESMSGAPLRNTRQLLYFYLPNVENRFMCYVVQDILSIMKVERRLTEELNHGIQGDDDDMFFRFPHNQMRVRMAEMEQAIRTRRNTFRLIREDLPYDEEGLLLQEGPPPPIYHLEPVDRIVNLNRVEGETDEEFERRVAESRIQVWEQPEVNNQRRARLNEMIQRFRRIRLVNNLNNIEGMIRQRLQEDVDPLILLEDAEDLDANIRLLERARAINNREAKELIKRAIDRLLQNKRGILDALEHPELFIDLLRRIRELRNRQARIRFERILHPVSPNWMEIQDDIRLEEERQLNEEPIVAPIRIEHLPEDFRVPVIFDFQRRFDEEKINLQRVSSLGTYLRQLDIRFSDEEIREMQEDPALRWDERRIRRNRINLNNFIQEPTLERWLLISEEVYHVRYRFREEFDRLMANAQELLPDEFAPMIDDIVERANEGHNIRATELVEIEALLLPENQPLLQRRIELLREYFQHLINLNRDRFQNDPNVINEFITRIRDLLRDEPSRLLSLENILTRLMMFMYFRIRRHAPLENRRWNADDNERQRNETVELLRGLQNNAIGMLHNELVVLEELVVEGLIIQEDLDRIAQIGGADDQNRFNELRDMIRRQLEPLREQDPENNLINEGQHMLEEIGGLEGVEFEVQNNRVEQFVVEQALIINRLRRLERRIVDIMGGLNQREDGELLENGARIIDALREAENAQQIDQVEDRIREFRNLVGPERLRLIFVNRDDGLDQRFEQLQREINQPIQNNVQQQVIIINDEYVQRLNGLTHAYTRMLELGNDRLFIEFRALHEGNWGNLVGEVGDEAINMRAGLENDVEELAQNVVRRLEVLRNQNNELIAGAIEGTRETMEIRLAEIADLHNEWMDNYAMTEARARHQLAVQGNLDDRNFRDEEFENQLERQMQERRRE